MSTMTSVLSHTELPPRSWTFTASSIPPSLNDRLHWRVRAKLNAAVRDEIACQVREAHAPMLQRARVTCTLIRNRGREKDLDNSYTSAKAAVDGLTAGGIIADDDRKHIDLLVTQERGPQRGVRITVEEVTA